MTHEAATVEARAVAMLKPGEDFAASLLETPDKVFVGIARPSGTVVLTVDKTEANGIDVARALGFELREPTAMEKAKRTKKA